MRKATRQFLRILAEAGSDATLVKVQRLALDYTKPNECFQNANKFLDRNEEFYLRSGWLVGEYWGESGTAIMPHYWVYDAKTNSDYDVTPIDDGQTYEYILDTNIVDSVSDELKITVPVAVKLYSDGQLSARVGVGKYVKLNRFVYSELFELAAGAGD
jgi:hypothetical protein